MDDLTYGVEPRMDGDVAQRLAWRVLALREALNDVRQMSGINTEAKVAANAIAVDDGNAQQK